MIDRSCFDKTKQAGLVGWWDRINNHVGINHKKVPERKKRKEKKKGESRLFKNIRSMILILGGKARKKNELIIVKRKTERRISCVDW